DSMQGWQQQGAHEVSGITGFAQCPGGGRRSPWGQQLYTELRTLMAQLLDPAYYTNGPFTLTQFTHAHQLSGTQRRRAGANPLQTIAARTGIDFLASEVFKRAFHFLAFLLLAQLAG